MLVEIYYMGLWGSFPLVTPHPHSYTTGPFSKTKQKSKTLSSGKFMYKSAFFNHTLYCWKLLRTMLFRFYFLTFLIWDIQKWLTLKLFLWSQIVVESVGFGLSSETKRERKEEALIKVPNCTSGPDCGQGRGPDRTSGDLQTCAEAFSYCLGFLVRKPRCTWRLTPSLFSSLLVMVWRSLFSIFPFFPQLLFLLLYSHVHLFHFLTIPCSIYLRCLHFILKLILNFYIIFPSLKLAVSPSDLWFQVFPIVPFSKSVIIYFS